MYLTQTVVLTAILATSLISCSTSSKYNLSNTGGKALELMKRLDSDGNVVITLDEWHKGKRRFRKLDSDRDDQITMDELVDRFGVGIEKQESNEQLTQSRGIGDESEVWGRVQTDFDHMDTNNDDKLTPTEWSRRGNFKKMDTDKNGFLKFSEVFAMYEPSSIKGMVSYKHPRRKAAEETENLIKNSKVGRTQISKITRQSLGKGDIKVRVKGGLFKTGLGPKFPKGADCFAIDDGYGLDYTFKRNREFYHGALDIPAPFGVPILAIADGTVINVSDGGASKKGNQITLRHSPKDTGLPVWIYALYAHLDKLPNFKTGQRVSMGEILGPTGNSGSGGRGSRRPAIHISLWFSDSPKYAKRKGKIIPKDALWMDPVAFYRKSMPIDSYSMRDLPEKEKFVPIPVVYPDGTTEPKNTKRIWPYACIKG